MEQGEYLGKHRTLNGRRFKLYKSVAPKTGKFDAVNFFAESEDSSTVEDISFMFGMGESIARTRGIANKENTIRFLTPLGLRHFYLILEEAEYGSQHRMILGPGSLDMDFNPDDRAFSREHNALVWLDILEFLERSVRNSRPYVTFTDVVNGCYALHNKLRFVLENSVASGLVNERKSFYSISQEGLTELLSMEKIKEARPPTTPSEKRDFFICHASEDKVEVAKPLADALIAHGYTVWLDEYEIVLGDDVPKNLSEGISMATFGILIMSPGFFEKHWTMQELSGFLMREIKGGSRILPIRHGLNPEEITELYPLLAGRFSISFDEGIDNVVFAIKSAFQKRKET